MDESVARRIMQGFDKLSPNGVRNECARSEWARVPFSPNGVRNESAIASYLNGLRNECARSEWARVPFALSLSKCRWRSTQGFDKLSPNGVRDESARDPYPNGAHNESVGVRFALSRSQMQAKSA